MKVFIILACVVISLPAQARGWVCTESFGLIQKYRLEGNNMIAEGDVGTELLKKAGMPAQTWNIIVNNEVAIIATMASAVTKPSPGQPGGTEIYIDVIMINKKAGYYKHFAKLQVGGTPDEFAGSCTTY